MSTSALQHGEHKRWTDARLVVEYQNASDEPERKLLATEIHRRATRDAEQMRAALGNIHYLPRDTA